MDLYVLDELLRSEEVVDYYESLIWTERYSSYGDFELVINANRGTRVLFVPGTRLAIDKSYRLMTVETVENAVDSEGVAKLKVTGRSAEAGLEDRSTRPAFAAGATPAPEITIIGTPGDIARAVFDAYCRNNIDIPEDNLPFLVAGSLLPAGTIPEPTDTISVTIGLSTVYEFIKNVCDVYNLGFRLLLDRPTSKLYFDVYTGTDRTTLQNAVPAVIFSQELENLANPSELTSVAQLKNVAYVFGENGTEVVYADNVSPTTAGFERRVLIVDASGITEPAGPTLTALLQQKGKEELSKYRAVLAFDAEIPKFGSYVYGVDYGLGDLLETRNSDRLATNMRVTEQIFISDAEGERSYPTLVIDQLITPGSWYAWDASQVWDDADEFWEDA